jgi:hypothetical protein
MARREYMQFNFVLGNETNYSETSIHRFCQGSEKETMDPGKQ